MVDEASLDLRVGKNLKLVRTHVTAWFRENRLPLIKATGNNVRFHIEDDVDDEGKVHFVTTTSEAVMGIDS